ncbi:esterase-like activity of phytase family protein [Variovorax saccharolyticus]|uniref:esterase-like activity of phytase family protein n=1 Tax=Variovorax saccharolyticus TaxID=3053516 RepID=UPI0025769BC9|nr:esterase-like activity of phytase family protein [Variovorax sp. J31P216]MDM0023962.1 esterase-like activity of phytase family protein [Variovorax sp. J31P216]
MNERSRMTWLAVVGAGLVVAACGGGGGGGTFTLPTGAAGGTGGTAGTGGGTSTGQSVAGVFLDAAVEGLDYVAGSAAKAVTSAKGEFACKTGETVSFSLGGLVIGSAACGAQITPLSLAGQQATPAGLGADAVVNRLIALQSFDEDGDPSNGIRITNALKATLKAGALDFSAPAASFDSALNTLLAALPAPYATRVSDAGRRALAREHFENTLASQLGTPVVETSTQNNALGAIAVSVTRNQLQADKKFYVPYEGANEKIKADFPDGFLPAYGSGLAFKDKAADGTLEFYAITDRGPNGDGPTAPVPGGAGTNISKVFPAPSFAPSFGLVTIGKGGAVLQSSVALKLDATTRISGLPPQSGVGSTGETPLNDAYVFDAAKANFDANGLDPETLVLDKARKVLWSSDEYGPFIVRINIETGVIEKRYAPGAGAADLPAVLAQRRPNRGMEGLALDAASGRLHGFLQSPIDPRDGAGKSIKAKPPGGSNTDVRHIAKFTRWLEFDPATERSKLYAYPIDGSQYDKDRTGNAKLGDVVSLGNGRFIVIEQGARKSDAKVFNKLVLVEIPADATDIAALDHNLEISSITQAPSNGADWSGVVTLRKTDLLDLNALGWMAEKAEGLTLVDDNTLALVNDNDFGLATTLLDANGQRVAGSVEDCTVDAAGAIVSGCPAGVVGARLTRGSDLERPTRLWLLRFDRKLTELRLPTP